MASSATDSISYVSTQRAQLSKMMFFFLIKKALLERENKIRYRQEEKDVVDVGGGGGARYDRRHYMLACCWLSLSATQARKYYQQRISFSSKSRGQIEGKKNSSHC